MPTLGYRICFPLQGHAATVVYYDHFCEGCVIQWSWQLAVNLLCGSVQYVGRGKQMKLPLWPFYGRQVDVKAGGNNLDVDAHWEGLS